MNKSKKSNILVSIFKVLSFVQKISSFYILNNLIKAIFESVFPFINIIFSYLILDGLINGYSYETIMIYVYCLVGLDLFVGIIISLTKNFSERQSILLEYSLSRTITKKSFELDYQQVEDNETMNLIEQAKEGSNSNGGLTSFIDNIFSGTINPILQMIYALIILGGLFKSAEIVSNNSLISFLNNPLSTLIIFAVLILVIVSSTLTTWKDSKLQYTAMMKNIDANRKFAYYYNVCNDYQKGKEIRLYNMHDMLIGLMQDKRFSFESAWKTYEKASIRFQIMVSVTNKLLLFVSYAFIGLKALYGLISIGSVVSYVASITALSVSINTFLRSFIYANQQASYLAHYFDFISLPTKMRYGKLDIVDKDIEIEFKDVHFSYPHQKEEIIKGVSFKINKYEKLAIVGLNGAGKTTLIKLLTRLYDPSEGEIFINGHDIKEYSKESLAKIYSVVFQDFKLFSFPIKNNVSSSFEGDSNKVKDSLAKAGILSRVEKMNKGIDTIIYERGEEQGVEISGGEAQKIVLI